MRNYLKLIWTAGICGAAIAIAGCSAGDAKKPPGEGPQPGMTLERRQLIIAENELTSICMRKQGFKHVTVIPPLREAPNPVTAEGDDVTTRKNIGYGLSVHNRGNGQDGVGVNGRYFNSLSKSEQTRWTRSYFGDDRKKINVKMPDGSTVTTNPDGCLSESRRILYGDISNYLRVYMVAVNYTGEAARITAADPTYTAATARWKECMSGSGYHFDSPNDAYEASEAAYEKSDDREKAHRQELSIATADAECNRKVRLTRLQNTLRKKNEQKVAQKYQADILAYRELEQSALKRAKKMIDTQLLNK